jgi:hypothetical protein
VGLETIGNSNGDRNVGIGMHALFLNETGSDSTAIGANALVLASGSNNIGIGSSAGSNLTNGSNNVYIANGGASSESNVIRLGAGQTSTFIAGIFGAPVNGSGLPIFVDSNGQLGTLPSSQRFKDEIAEMGDISAALMKLRPVTFYYKADQNAARTLQYGLIAEEVDAILPGLVIRGVDGHIESVRYQFLAPMLLNEYQRQQRTIDAQQRTIDAQAEHIRVLERQCAEIAALKGQTVRVTELLMSMGLLKEDNK